MSDGLRSTRVEVARGCDDWVEAVWCSGMVCLIVVHCRVEIKGDYLNRRAFSDKQDGSRPRENR